MSKILIAYSTVDGQTKKIAETLSKQLNGDVSLKLFNEVVSLEEYDFIIVGSSIRYGRFPQKLYHFVQKNQKILIEKNADFFGVNLIARTPEKCFVDNNVYVRKFLEKIEWQPNNIKIFAGALNYTTYNFFDRKMIQLIMKITKGPTDTRYDIEFTDWEQVENYATQVNQRA
ncbi:menaquinone-dependent protoporphyrinogen IX dehydrogenase [Vagococcus vulneris]|uniref:Protoporphyrinogen IX dehydrogenase [quinone] n=1 Tax=Vagococcus vulneris TaxID=1977869 RepID=A0A429ZZK3_9ENTE|nr:menaquinone-dependent protoporphyrinogen IX dehydrogenase [Vagococcus vulneris]RST99482.1 hypothetical protein CBF37_03930 [Vagococcus vulneris]